MSKSDGEFSGERVKAILMTSGPQAITEALRLEFSDLIARIVYSLLRDKHCHNPKQHYESVVNSTWVNVLKEFHKCYSGLKEANFTNPRKWLITIAIHLSYKHLSADIKKERREVSPTAEPEADEISGEDELDYLFVRNNNFDVYRQIKEDSPEAEMLRKELCGLIEDCIRALPQPKRAIFVLHYEGCSYKEIGKILDIDPNNAKTIVSRLTRSIRQQLNGLNGGLR